VVTAILTPTAGNAPTLDDVFSALSTSQRHAIEAALAHLNQGGDPETFIARFRDTAFPTVLKEHPIKHPAATFEEAGLAAPKWRNRLLAATLHYGVEPTYKLWADYNAGGRRRPGVDGVGLSL
jgi:hypothetical protein